MSDSRDRKRVSRAVGVFAALSGLLGAIFLFAAGETGSALTGRSEAEPLAALLGASLLGLGAMNWTARLSLLGGIYGRAVVVGSQTQLFVGALVLSKYVLGGSRPKVLWILTGFYVVGCALYSYLLWGAQTGAPAPPADS
jgi:hypothetical protein